ncbi:unnamed protein product [Cuscuta campestris]|uniref:Uncharacterized protein n=1 Tax=Cuscuta campestris TaxID=132261 RepID=A0A484KW72_9ASTE|nr:unnamed protein product [Cuscuta campestris]
MEEESASRLAAIDGRELIQVDPVQLDLAADFSLKRRRPSTLDRAYSDRTLRLLATKASFPNVSKCVQQNIKFAVLDTFFKDTSELPDPRAIGKEYKIGSYFDTERPVYSESLLRVPNVEVGTQLNVLELLGDTLLGFNLNVPNFQPTKFRCYAGLCDPNMGALWGFKPGKHSHNPQRIQPPRSRTACKENVNIESTLILKGKYVMICCVYVPSIWCSTNGPNVYHTALASHELARRDDFVLVVVPMMREGFTHSRSAYLHFLSGFSCYAVPFHDSRRREYICSALGFGGKIKVMILDPSLEVRYHGSPCMFQQFGGAEHDCFPFTPERLNVGVNCHFVLQDLSLNELLGLSDTDVLCNISKDARTTISELKQKFVGIYVCSDFRSLEEVQEVHKECRRRKYELEIVVVGCPFDMLLPPKLHEDLIIGALASLKLLGWWFYPFNNTLSLRLSQMRDLARYEEGLFIVDPIEKYVDPYGLQIITDFGMDYYPFTRRNVVKKELQRKMGLRLSSLLLPWEYLCRKRDSSSSIVEVSLTEVLKNKIVVLYLHNKETKFLADKLAAWYEKNMKRKHSNFVEVVVVSIGDGSMGTSDEDLMDKGWFVCRADPSKSAKLCDEYFHPLCAPHETLVAFGEDGRIQSMDPNHILESQFPPFHGNLPEQIARQFDCAGSFYMRRYDYSLL